jgi:hypothetical protein
MRNNDTPEDYEVDSDKLLIKHFWNKKHKIRKPKEQFHDHGRPYYEHVFSSELFYDLNEDSHRRYEERSFYSAKLGKTEFKAHCMKYGTSDMDDHGNVSLDKEIGEFDIFYLQNSAWDLKKCFFLPVGHSGFHKKELYGFQKEVIPTPLAISKYYRMYTNNSADTHLYLALFELTEGLTAFANRKDLRVVLKEDAIMLAVSRMDTPPFSASIKKNIKDGQEIRRIDANLANMKSVAKELDTLIQEGVKKPEETPANKTE